MRGPPSIANLVLTLLARNGQVASGVLDILQEFPVVHVTVDALPSLVSDPSKYRLFAQRQERNANT
jgi:hypothetical protein